MMISLRILFKQSAKAKLLQFANLLNKKLVKLVPELVLKLFVYSGNMKNLYLLFFFIFYNDIKNFWNSNAGDQNLISQLLPAMQNIQNALNAAQVGGKIKVSTVHSMAVLGQSDPPSTGAFNSAYADTMKQLLQFQRANGSPLTINPYPFFAYQSDPRPETLAFCLFQPNAGRVDSRTGIKYMNMFDAQVIQTL